MALDPNIALQVRPFKMDSPINAMAQMYQLQGAQQANQLNAMQMAEYERARTEEEGVRNYLAGADLKSPDVRAKLTTSFGKTGLGYAKTLAEQEAAALKQKADQLKYTTDMTEAAAKIYGTVKDEASWQTARKKLTALGGDASTLPLTYDPAYVQQEKMTATNVKDQLELFAPKPKEVKRADGSIIFLDENPRSPTFNKEIMTQQKPGMTQYEAARIGVENQRLAQDATGVVYQEDANGNIVALPSKLKKGEVPTGRVAVAPGGGFQPMQAKPSESVGAQQMSINQQRAIVKGAIDAVTKTPDAFGMTRGLMPESLGGRMASSEENQARSYLFNVVSGVIKERAGTAQSAAEADTLARFLPQPTDEADTIKDKMEAFDKYLTAKESGTTKKRGGAPKAELAPMDQQALQWANSNPGDPRAAAIKQRLGQ
jgi:hypothetical protein